MGHHYIWSEFVERRRTEGSIVVEMPDGFTLTVPPVEFWPDKLPAATDKALRLIVGDEDVDRFLAAGGTMKLLDKLILDAQGLTRGE